MKSYRKSFLAAFAALFITAFAFAADASPTGTWKWTSPGRGGNPGREQKVKLDYKDGALTGTALGGQGPMGEIPDAPISEASFKDGVVKFSVARQFGERKFTAKYEGKLEGDTIKGTTERPGRDGETRKDEWTATRVTDSK